MTITIKNTKDLQMPWVHVFLYGDLGTGKTTIASSWPMPFFVVPQNEKSVTTLKGMDVQYVEIAGPRKIDDVDGMEDVLTYLEASHQQYRRALAQGEPEDKAREFLPCDTLIMESLTHYMDLYVAHITNGDKQSMDQQKWGTVRSHFRTLQARLRRIPIHVIWTSLAEHKQDDKGSKAGGGPAVSGATKMMLPSACDIVGFCTLRSGKPDIFETHFRAHQGFAARTRFRAMPDKIQDFTFDKIVQFLQ